MLTIPHTANITILAAHPDDAELACGAAIHRLSLHRNANLSIVLACTGGDTKYEQAVREQSDIFNSNLLGHKAITKLGFKRRTLSSVTQRLTDKLIESKEWLSPEIVFLPSSFDGHQDHQALRQAGLRAFSKTKATILGYEMPWNNQGGRLDTYLEVSEWDLETQFEAIRQFRSQSDRPYMKPLLILELAKIRGIQAGVQYAVAFESALLRLQ